MSKLRVACYGMSLDGFGAGPDQSLENPMGVGGMALHGWVFPTRFFSRCGAPKAGRPGSTTISRRAASPTSAPGSSGATCSGRCAAPGPTTAGRAGGATSRRIIAPVFVLTHHPRPPLEMAGGTDVPFRHRRHRGGAGAGARAAAGGKDVRVGGGAATVRQYLQAGLIDEMHLAVSPAPLGRGEPLLAGIDLPGLGFRVSEHMMTENAMHVVLAR